MAKSAEFETGKRLGRLATGAAVTALALGGIVAAAGAAGAAPVPSGPNGLQPITEDASYPAPLPDGCAGGANALTGVQFSNSSGLTTGSFSNLAGSVHAGETLTMTWTGYTPGCADVTVSMAAYRITAESAQLGYFDPAVDQELLPGWTACGGDAPACEPVDGTYRLSITVPTTDVACLWQLDALLGRPLAVVGPSGSFYNSKTRNSGESMQIDYLHWGTDNCVPATQPTTVTTLPTTPTTTPDTTPTTTPVTTPSTTPTSVAPEVQPTTVTTMPTEVEAVQVSSTPTTEAPTEVLGITATRLPETGAKDSGLLAGVAAALLAAGAGLVAQARRLTRREA
jgi:LPXTG-motif cell wall-anchored protein